MTEINKKYLDYRVTDRYLAKGLLKKDEYKKHLESLSDSEEQAEWIQMDLHDTEVGEENSNEMIEEEIPTEVSSEEESASDDSISDVLPEYEPKEEV